MFDDDGVGGVCIGVVGCMLVVVAAGVLCSKVKLG